MRAKPSLRKLSDSAQARHSLLYRPSHRQKQWWCRAASSSLQALSDDMCPHMCSVHHSCFLVFLPHTPRHISFRKASTIPRQDHRGYKTDLCTAEWRAQRGNQGARVIQGAHPQYAPLLFCTATLRPCITAGFGAVFPM